MSNSYQYISAVHQPNFFPWIGYFIKMRLCDVFIILDDVQLQWRGYTRRTKIAKPGCSDRLQWFTLPIDTSDTFSIINRIDLKNPAVWQHKALKQLTDSYRQYPFFEETFELAKEWILLSEKNLGSFNVFGIRRLMDILHLKTPIRLSSETPVLTTGSKRIADLMKQYQSNIYLSGRGGNKYHHSDDFIQEGIQVLEMPDLIQQLQPIKMRGIHPEASILDWFFRLGFDETRYLLEQYSQNITLS